jgi:hypothetical protein
MRGFTVPELPVDGKVYKESKVHPTIMARLFKSMEKNPLRHARRHRGRKWQEVVEDAGVRYVVNLRNEDGLDVVIGLRRAKNV